MGDLIRANFGNVIPLKQSMRVLQDKHHILHHRVEWTARSQAAQLRETPQLIPLIDRDVHNEIHAIAPPVPLLGVYALNHTIAAFEPRSSTLDTLDALLLAIDKAGNHRRAHSVERAVAQAAMQALEIQRAILRGNL